jgi:hypothetical protein
MMVFNPAHGGVVAQRNKLCPACNGLIDSNDHVIPRGDTRRFHRECVSCE